MFQIKGKVALLVGPCRGVCCEITRQLLQNHVRVVVIAEPINEVGKIQVQKLKDEFGEMRIYLLQVDILNPKELESVYLTTIKLFDHLDIVINNVGTIDESDIDRNMTLTTITAMRSTKLAVNVYLPQHKLGTEGVVINVNCVVSLGNTPNLLTGLSGLTAGNQYERNNIRVISLFLGVSQPEILGGLMTSQLVQTISNIPDLRIQPGLESAGRALIGAIEQGVNGSSWVGVRQSVPESLIQGNWSLSQMRL
ncbi:short chain dehydrogenase [Popillia japonica]|uniref:Short chain dehydrogenase n=1 Tax=Popillia japonica TaxID=7064 RepID=A0AAW1LS88_POPJA